VSAYDYSDMNETATPPRNGKVAERASLIDELYTMLDRGLDKRDAERLVEMIERLADLRTSPKPQ
jgi:hypothetical protein